jgi:hypothetical protein
MLERRNVASRAGRPVNWTLIQREYEKLFVPGRPDEATSGRDSL